MMDLSGEWEFSLDANRTGLTKGFQNSNLGETIGLPTTSSEAGKGPISDAVKLGCLTDPRAFEGWAWYSRVLDIASRPADHQYRLELERTRLSRVWVDGREVGGGDSLCVPHRYDLSGFLSPGRHRLSVLVDNASYPTRGGHMTSEDTQTNWNGILGGICLKESGAFSIESIQTWPSRGKKSVRLAVMVKATRPGRFTIEASAECRRLGIDGGLAILARPETRRYDLAVNAVELGQEKRFDLDFPLGDGALEWDEYHPNVYRVNLRVLDGDEVSDDSWAEFGLRDFGSVGLELRLNDTPIFLRGKHDGLIFPLSGYAPMDFESWLKVLGTAKSYGINHYRFHTCCPPGAAFRAADYLGVYLEPELPFWGTVRVPGDEAYNDAERNYLVQEGFRILREYGNSPSFFAFSMGNELWGDRGAINQIMGGYKAMDDRHLYTQGSNNHQFVPAILPNDDFFCGVRLSKRRLFRGSYAMCDAPLGHVQTDPPNSATHYDDIILPPLGQGSEKEESLASVTDTMKVQYGTGVSEVRAKDQEAELEITVPLVSHEIGQYVTAPNYDEIPKYTGVLKPRNLEAFRQRLEGSGMLGQWRAFFMASGRLAGECYRRELESALNSKNLSGFQILDLQDFSGQGTALVGILDAFMENKGTVSRQEWLSFCGDAVLLPNLPSFVYGSGEEISVPIRLRYYRPKGLEASRLWWRLSGQDGNLRSEGHLEIGAISGRGLFELAEARIRLPDSTLPLALRLGFEIVGTGISKAYDLWVYPPMSVGDAVRDVQGQGNRGEKGKASAVTTAVSWAEAAKALNEGQRVLFLPAAADNPNSIEGCYASDFWCYPMFRSISESMGKPLPIGTLGLLVDAKHPALAGFPSHEHTSAQWHSIVSSSRSTILDGTDIEPIVWTIDNFERNHRLGLIFEARVGEGRLLVCGSWLAGIEGRLEAAWLLRSLLAYAASPGFEPRRNLSPKRAAALFGH